MHIYVCIYLDMYICIYISVNILVYIYIYIEREREWKSEKKEREKKKILLDRFSRLIHMFVCVCVRYRERKSIQWCICFLSMSGVAISGFIASYLNALCQSSFWFVYFIFILSNLISKEPKPSTTITIKSTTKELKNVSGNDWTEENHFKSVNVF